MLSSDRSSAPRLLLTVGQLAVILKRVHEPLDGVVSLADVVALKVTLGVRADLDHGTIAGLHAGAVGAVARTAQRNDVERVAAPERPRNNVRRVDAMLGSAADAGPSRDRRALRVGRRHRRRPLE